MKHLMLGTIVLIYALQPVPSFDRGNESGGPLTLSKAFELTLKKNPALSMFARDKRIAEARRLQAGLHPNPEFSFEIESISLTEGSDFISTIGNEREIQDGASSGFGEAEYTLSFSQLIELGGKRMKRVRAAELEGKAFHQSYEIARADVLSDVAAKFLEVLGAQERVRLSEEILQLTSNIVDTISARVSAGQVSPIEKTRSNIQVSQVQISLSREKRHLEAARMMLAATWGADEPQFGHAVGALEQTPKLKTGPELKAMIENTPDLSYWTSELNHLTSLVTLERSQSRPHLEVTFGYRMQNLDSRDFSNFDSGAFQGAGRNSFLDSREDSFVLEFSLPLQLFNRNQGNIREAGYQVQKASARRSASEFRIRSLIDSSLKRLDAVKQEVEGAADVQVDQVSGTPQLAIRIKRDAIARYGINVEDVQHVITASVGGETAGQIFEGIRRYDILVRFAPEYRQTLDAIKNILIKSPDGIRVPLSELASVEEIIGPRQITREKNQRFITIQCNVVGRDIGTFVEDAQGVIGTEVDLPDGYFVTWGGQFRLQQEANKRLAIVVPATDTSVRW